MLERILIPLDGSARAEVILSLVARLLRREDSEVLLFRSFDVPMTIESRVDRGTLLAQDREEAQRYVHDLARRFREQGAKVHARVGEGPAAESILNAAREEGATMIAMSTHGRSGISRWLLGSVAEKVIRASDVPVLLVRSFRRTPKGDLEPVTPQELPVKRILVATDGSDASLAAVAPAEKLALLFGSEIIALHVLSPYVTSGAILPGMDAGAVLPPPPPPESDQDPATAKMAERFGHAGLKVKRLTVVGDPAGAILDRSQEEGADLLAIATHGRTGFSRWLLGSVAERVLRSATVPLLIVRAPAKAAPKKRAAKAAGAAAV